MAAWWQTLGEVLGKELAGLADGPQMIRVLFRLSVAVMLGGVLGYQRERTGKAAGMRTHMLVTLSAALFVLTAEIEGVAPDGVSRVIQGVVTGMGFIGAGAILKLSAEREVRGLTTAAGIWMATAIGMAVGVGQVELALPGTVFALLILAVLHRFEQAPEPGLESDKQTTARILLSDQRQPATRPAAPGGRPEPPA